MSLSNHIRRAGALGALALPALAAFVATGCPDPGGKFDEFTERYDRINPGTTATGPGACTAPAPGDADGDYLFTLSANLNQGKAFVLIGTLTTEEGADGGLIADLSLQPLTKLTSPEGIDDATEVGEPLELTDQVINADGSFTWDFGEITLIGAGNPISPSDVVSTLQITGAACDGEEIAGTSYLGFICGTVSGIVVSPLMGHDLASGKGSNFTMQLIEDPGARPPPAINCDKDPAEY